MTGMPHRTAKARPTARQPKQRRLPWWANLAIELIVLWVAFAATFLLYRAIG